MLYASVYVAGHLNAPQPSENDTKVLASNCNVLSRDACEVPEPTKKRVDSASHPPSDLDGPKLGLLKL